MWFTYFCLQNCLLWSKESGEMESKPVERAGSHRGLFFSGSCSLSLSLYLAIARPYDAHGQPPNCLLLRARSLFCGSTLSVLANVRNKCAMISPAQTLQNVLSNCSWPHWRLACPSPSVDSFFLIKNWDRETVARTKCILLAVVTAFVMPDW